MIRSIRTRTSAWPLQSGGLRLNKSSGPGPEAPCGVAEPERCPLAAQDGEGEDGDERPAAALAPAIATVEPERSPLPKTRAAPKSG